MSYPGPLVARTLPPSHAGGPKAQRLSDVVYPAGSLAGAMAMPPPVSKLNLQTARDARPTGYPVQRIPLSSPSRSLSQATSQANSQPSSLPPSLPASQPASGATSPRCPASEWAEHGVSVELPRGAPELSPAVNPSASLESVQEEGANQTRQPTLQELKEQLLVERAWWQKTSAASLTKQVDQLRKEVEIQQVTLAKIAEHLLNPSGLNFCIDETPQVLAIQATLEELKTGLSQQEKTQEIQAKALREGLMEIHDQRTVLTNWDHQMKAQIQKSREGIVSLPAPAEGTELQAWIVTEFNKLRSEMKSSPVEVCQVSSSADNKEALELHAQLASDLADVITRSEEQRVEFSKAVAAERLARITEVSELRTCLDGASVEVAEGALARLRSELTEDRAQRTREASEAKVYFSALQVSTDKTVSALAERTDRVVNQLMTADRESERRVEDLATQRGSLEAELSSELRRLTALVEARPWAESFAELSGELQRIAALVDARPWADNMIELSVALQSVTALVEAQPWAASTADLSAELRRVAAEVNAQPWMAALDERANSGSAPAELSAEWQCLLRRVAAEVDAQPWMAALEERANSGSPPAELSAELQFLSAELQRVATAVDARPWEAMLEGDRAGLQDMQKLAEMLQQENTSVQRQLERMAKYFETAQASTAQALTAKGESGAPLDQVLALIRDAQDMLRFEFSARMTEMEMTMRDAGRAPSQPRADADELATRLEAIKAQLRTEIEKRIERAPGSLPPPSGMDDQLSAMTRQRLAGGLSGLISEGAADIYA